MCNFKSDNSSRCNFSIDVYCITSILINTMEWLLVSVISLPAYLVVLHTDGETFVTTMPKVGTNTFPVIITVMPLCISSAVIAF
jgi:hypothetical protein